MVDFKDYTIHQLVNIIDEHKQYQEDLQDLRKRLDIKSTDLDLVIRKKTELQNKVTQLNTELNELRVRSKENIAMLVHDKDNLQEKIKRGNTQLTELENENIQLKSKLAQHHNANDTVEKAKQEQEKSITEQGLTLPEQKELAEKLLTGFEFFSDFLHRMMTKVDENTLLLNDITKPYKQFAEELKGTLDSAARVDLLKMCTELESLFSELHNIYHFDAPGESVEALRLYSTIKQTIHNMREKWKIIIGEYST